MITVRELFMTIVFSVLHQTVPCSIELRSWGYDDTDGWIGYAYVESKLVVNFTKDSKVLSNNSDVRGINTFLLHPSNSCQAYDIRRFDLIASPEEASVALVNYINGLQSGVVLNGLSCDSAADKLTAAAISALRGIGVLVCEPTVRGKLTFVAPIGKRNSTVFRTDGRYGSNLVMNVTLDAAACASNPCQHGATCLDTDNGYFVCTCQPEFTGSYCDTKCPNNVAISYQSETTFQCYADAIPPVSSYTWSYNGVIQYGNSSTFTLPTGGSYNITCTVANYMYDATGNSCSRSSATLNGPPPVSSMNFVTIMAIALGVLFVVSLLLNLVAAIIYYRRSAHSTGESDLLRAGNTPRLRNNYGSTASAAYYDGLVYETGPTSPAREDDYEQILVNRETSTSEYLDVMD